jgi:hypothetical protein
VCWPITFNHGVEGSSPSALTKDLIQTNLIFRISSRAEYAQGNATIIDPDGMITGNVRKA